MVTANFMNIEDLASGGVLPIGPVCPWPKTADVHQTNTRKISYIGKEIIKEEKALIPLEHDTTVKVSMADMAKSLFKNTKYAVQNGKISAEIREERYSICKKCPHFIEDSKRCSECGCFMEAKTWIGADPKVLCPKQKWPR